MTLVVGLIVGLSLGGSFAACMWFRWPLAFVLALTAVAFVLPATSWSPPWPIATWAVIMGLTVWVTVWRRDLKALRPPARESIPEEAP